jgi:endonuclease-3
MSPYPDHRAPSAHDCQAACAGLVALHGEVRRDLAPTSDWQHDAAQCGKVPGVIEALIATILSQNTTNKNSSAAMRNLMATFDGDLHRMREAGADAIAQAIVQGGLSQVKGRVIKKMLDHVAATQPTLSLDYLHDLPDAEALAVLQSFAGVGPKTASCVLLFCLNRESFAVDTHVWRIAKRLGWVPDHASRDQTYLHLDERIPAELKYPLHVLMVQHGKCCPECAPNHRPQQAALGPCPLQPVRVAKAHAPKRRRMQASG